MSSWLVIDTETTGLLQPWSCVAEFAAVWVLNGVGQAAFTTLVRPDILDYRAEEGLRINHLDPAQLRVAPTPDDLRGAFATWCQQLPPDTWTTAFNAPFDRQHCERLSLLLPSWGACLMQRARRHLGVRSVKLQDAVGHFGLVPHAPAHRALSDAYTAAALLVALDEAEATQGTPQGTPQGTLAHRVSLAPGALNLHGGAAQAKPPAFQPPPTAPSRDTAEVVADLHALQTAPRVQREPILRFENEFFFLSNFYLCPVQIHGWTFPSSEHAFQAMKSNNPAKEWPYFLKGSPGAAKKLGRAIQCRPDWLQVRDAFMRAVVYDKFTRNKELGEKLRETWDAPLVEGNTWHDLTWGSCTCSEHAGTPGENRLGKILMEVREELFKMSPF